MTTRRKCGLAAAIGVVLLLVLSGCAEKIPLPVQFEGTYVADDVRYSGRYIRLTTSKVTIGVSERQERSHSIRAVYTQMEQGDRFYEVVYQTGYGTDSLRFSGEGDGEIFLKHPAGVRWVRGEQQ